MKKSHFLFLILFIFTTIVANLLKVNTLEGQSFDAAPLSDTETVTNISVPEKEEIKIASSFASIKPQAPSVYNLSSPIIDVSDMSYNNNKYYNSNAIMHHTLYSRFYYAHNTGAFSGLKNLSVGQTFILGGNTYKVAAVSLIDYSTAAKTMNSIVTAKYSGTQYDISMMTCSGARTQQTKTGSTSTHRLIVYANRI